MPLRVIQHYSDWVCTAVMSNDVVKDLRVHSVGKSSFIGILQVVHYNRKKGILVKSVKFQNF